MGSARFDDYYVGMADEIFTGLLDKLASERPDAMLVQMGAAHGSWSSSR